MGVDIDFQRRSRIDRPEYPAGSHDGTPGFFAPPGVPILAARPGTVWSVTKSPKGWSVVINHGAPFATYYQHLDMVVVAKGMPVIAGTMLGTMGWDPQQGASAFRHLHFAVWLNGHGDASSVDPGSVIGKWTRPPDWKA
jgi:murein DD-endopeptidase MepM/ murein hydrolase activator NlpD